MASDASRTAPEALSPIPWHTLAPDDALARLDALRSGLSNAEAARRLAAYGPNELAITPPESPWRILRRQFQSFGVGLLLLAAGVALWSGDGVDGIVIGVVLGLNVGIGFVTELRARRAMEALRRLATPWATVVREGRARRIEAKSLVPGDVIHLEAGQIVPADARLLVAAELRAVEAALTGESVPVDKAAAVTLAAPTMLPDRSNMVFGATTVVAGRGEALVVATGAHTEVGRIGALVSSIHEARTPLERRLDTLGWQLAVVALAIGALVGFLAWLNDRTLAEVLEMGLAMAVAAVPEGLPAVVTITMAIGAHRMARRHALVRRLAAVETVGSATVICTDKTGTLTAGEQTVTTLWLPDREIRVTGAGYKPEGEFHERGRVVRAADDPALVDFLRAALLANRAQLQITDGEVQSHGDPTDLALLVAGRKAGLDRAAEAARFPEIGEVPFSSTRMLMATFHRGDGRVLAMVKGAPARVLAICTWVRTSSGDARLDDTRRATIARHNDALAARGLRVLAVASGAVAEPGEPALRDLTFLGLAGLTDPPSAGVAATIRRLRGAGVRTIMLTGDQRGTAVAVAHELGLMLPGDRVLEGADVARLGDDALAGAVADASVISRISPEDKLRVVAALRERGEIVAMLGDGVNDAAALRRADIGIAMGRRGTDVAKEAAGIVLADDRFVTVAAAVEEGRVIYDNIRKFVFYLASCNLAEIVTLLGAAVVGLPLPVTPLQILWLNLVTDSLPALALALEPAESEVMRRPPRHPQSQIVPPRMAGIAALYALIIATVTLVALWFGLHEWPGQPARAVTLSFTTLALAQLFHLGNARRVEAVTSLRGALANPLALAALALTVALQVLAVSVPPVAALVDAVPLSARGWMVAFGLALVPALAGQGAKIVRGIVNRARLARA